MKDAISPTSRGTRWIRAARTWFALTLCCSALPPTALAEPLLSAHITVGAPGVSSDSLASFGLDYAATDAFDAGVDLFAPPAPPGNWVVAYFDRPEWGQIWNRFMTDLRAPFTSETYAKEWRLTVSTNIDAEITVGISNADIPADYEVRLLDTGLIQTVLVEDFQHNVYTFHTGGGSRDFVVQVRCPGCLTGVDDEVAVTPGSFSLQPNYPNPFNASTAIQFTLTRAAQVDLRVYNLLGQPVARLADGRKPAGDYRVIWNAHDAPTGVYFIRLVVGNEASVVKAVLLK